MSYGSHAERKLVDCGHFDAIVPTVSAAEAALFPEGHGDDDAAALAAFVAAAVAGRAAGAK